MTTLSGPEAQQVGFTVKSRLRDFIANALRGEYNSRYRAFGGVDVVLVQQVEEETPNGKPLLSIRTIERDRSSYGDGTRHDFQIEARIVTDSASGGLEADASIPALGEALSDDLDELLTTDGVEATLEALGIHNLAIGKRREQSIEGVHTNRHTITCTAVTD